MSESLAAQISDLHEVLEVLQAYIEQEDDRSILYERHPGLRPIFDFFGTRLADEYRLLLSGVEDLSFDHDMLAFELFRTGEGCTVSGGTYHRLCFKKHCPRRKLVLCTDSRGQAFKIASDRVVLLVKPHAQATRDLMESILAL